MWICPGVGGGAVPEGVYVKSGPWNGAGKRGKKHKKQKTFILTTFEYISI